MATIRKRGNKYHVQVRRKGLRPVTRSFQFRGDAVAWARHMEVQADRQELPPDPNQLRAITVGQLLTRYLEAVTPRKKTADRERIMLGAVLRRPIASLRLSDVRSADFAAYRDHRLAEVKPASVARELAPLRHMFEVARREWGLPLRSNPVASIAISGIDRRRERRLRPGELSRLVSAAKTSRNRYLVPIILFALVTAMRRGEILAMEWRDLDGATNSLLIPRAKNGYPRVIPILPEAMKIIDDLPRTGDRVFPIAANALRLAWERLRRRAGLDDLHFHDLRHEAVSRLFEAGLSTAEVALVSGHRDARMLFRYAHATRQRIVAQLSSVSLLNFVIDDESSSPTAP